MLYQLLLFTALLLLNPLHGGAQDFSGTYAVTAPEGLMTLVLVQDGGGEVTGTLALPDGVTYRADGMFSLDEDDEAEIEGTLTAPQGRAEFSFYADDEDGEFYFLMIPYDATGTPSLNRATEYEAQRLAEADPQAHPPSDAEPTRSPEPTGRDLRLVGTWATQVLTSTSAGSMTTQLFMAFRADGTLLDLGARSLGSIPGVSLDTGLEGGGEVAAWRTEGNRLLVRSGLSPWVPLARYEISGNTLLLVYYDGDRKQWHRQ